MSDYVRHEEWVGALRLRIIADTDPVNPREDWDHPGTVMCCDHRRYRLGDENAHAKVARLVRASRCYRPGWETSEDLDFRHGPDLWAAVRRCRDIVSLPCFLYDHSGITMSTGAFSCPWDSGQVGFICIAKPDILAIHLKAVGSRLTQALRTKALALLEAEVRVYDMYLTGDVWGYVVDCADDTELPDGNVRSCWDIFGYEDAEAEDSAELCRAVAAFPELAAAGVGTVRVPASG